MQFHEGKKFWHIIFSDASKFSDWKTIHLKGGMARIGRDSESEKYSVHSVMLSKDKYNLTAAKLAAFYYVRYLS